jgi:hypothetical protein
VIDRASTQLRAIRYAHTLVRAETDPAASDYILTEIVDAGDGALTAAVEDRLAQAARLIAEAAVAWSLEHNEEGHDEAVDRLLTHVERVQAERFNHAGEETTK